MGASQDGNNVADGAADFGRRTVDFAVVDARRNLYCVCGRWYPVIMSLHRFFFLPSLGRWLTVLTVRVLPLTPSSGLLVPFPKDAMFHGPAFVWNSAWVHFPPSVTTDDDVGVWPCSVGILVKWVAFLGTSLWLADRADLGFGGISHVEMSLLYEMWAGERLVLEKASPRYRRPGRPISVSAVHSGPGIDIWRTCRFIGALMRSLCTLPGGTHRFVLCAIGANHCRLRRIGWGKSGHLGSFLK